MKKLLTCILTLCVSLLLYAQHDFDPLTLDALSNSKITAFAEDSDGYMWIGTRRGLNRYNGSVYKKFFSGVDSLSLSSDKIMALCADSDGRMWVATDAGINLIQDGKVRRKSSLDRAPSYCLHSYNARFLLASSEGGLLAYDKDSGQFSTVVNSTRIADSFFIESDIDGKIWIAGHDCTVMVLDADFSIVEEIVIPGNDISGMCVTADGDIAVSTDTGLFLYDFRSRNIKMLPEGINALVSNKRLLFAVNDPKYARTVIGIADEGLFSLKFSSGDIHRLWPNEKLNSCSRCIAYVTQNNLWLSKNREGYTLRYRNPALGHVSIPNLGNNEGIMSHLSTERGNSLIVTNKRVFEKSGTDGGGSIRDITPPSLLGRTIIASRYIGNMLWVIDSGTLMGFSLQGGALRLQHSFSVSNPRFLWGTPENNVALMQDDGIFLVKQDHHGFFRITNASIFTDCCPAPNEETYLLTTNAVYLLQKDMQMVTQGDGLPVPVCAVADHSGRIWVGTQNNGIIILSPIDDTRTALTMEDGLPDNAVRSIVFDGEDGVYISTRGKISYMSLKTLEFKTYDEQPDFPREFRPNSAFRDDNGTFFFSGIDGIVSISGASNPSFSSEVRIEMDGITTQDCSMENPEERHVFGHKNNTLSFYYSGLCLDEQIGSLQYEYILLGHDKDWTKAGNTTRASYSNLSGGKYCFMARVRFLDGSTSINSLSYSFRVKPSPWLSWPALLLYIMTTLALACTAYKIVHDRRLTKDRIEKAALEKAIMSRINQEKINFFTDASHEFRTPLSLIYSPAKELLALGDDFSPKARKLVETIDKNAERMYLLTDQLLAFNKAESERNGLSVMKVNLSQRLQSLVKDFSYLFEKKNITLNSEIKSNMLGWCDTGKLERIVFNLISNAAKYTPEGGSVFVRLLQDKDNAVVEVADTGIGVSDADKEKIFGRFERGVKEDEADDGFGIGLHFAQHLALLHKGKISVRDNNPKGSVFSYHFPILIDSYDDAEIWTSPEENEEPGQEDDTPLIRRNDLLILVVEDNEGMRHYVADMLSEEYDVITASNGMKALEKMKAAVPDLLVSDVMMPVMDGITLLGKIKDSPEYCHIPVVMLSAKTDIDSTLEGISGGAEAYIPKPFEKKYLQATVAGIFENRKRLQARLSGYSSPVQAESEPSLSPKDKTFVERLYALLEENIGNENLTMSDLYIHLGMGRTSLWSKVQTLFGVSPRTLILNYRMNKAMELLKAGKMNVSEVGYAVGFSSPSAFSRAFHEKFGASPSSVLHGKIG